MKTYPFKKIICIDRDSSVPFYLQIAHCILQAIESGKLQNDDVLPSINELSASLKVARDTAEKGYNYLKGLGVLGAVVGKGYFVKNMQWGNRVRVFLLFSQLSCSNEIIYNSFVNRIGDMAIIDFHVFNNDYHRFNKILRERQEEYDYYVILPGVQDDAGDLPAIIDMLPKEKLIVVGKRINELAGHCSGVYENFEHNIFQALEAAVQHLRKYHSIGLVSAGTNFHHSAILKGLRRFCSRYGFHCRTITDLSEEAVVKGIAYITLQDDDLARLVEQMLVRNLQAGKDVGVLSYNETPLKKIILNGIATISTDFAMMGEHIAGLILNRSIEQRETGSFLTLRDSL